MREHLREHGGHVGRRSGSPPDDDARVVLAEHALSRNPSLREVPCNYCGSDQRQLLLTVERYKTDENRYVVTCKHCGLIFVCPRKLQDYRNIEGEFYERDYFKAVNVKAMIGLLDRLEAFTPQRGRLLDIGCSVGFLLDAARARGWDTVGIEPSVWAAEWGKMYLQLAILPTTLDKVSFPEASFDAITMVEVIEHCEDPSGSLMKVHALLKPGGMFFLTTPNIESRAFAKKGKDWGVIDPYGHIYYFSPRTIRMMLEKANLRVVASQQLGGEEEDEQLVVFATRG